MRAPAPLLAALLLAVPAPARAQAKGRLVPPPRARANLAYERGPGLASCPDERALRLAVRAELGYDPFVDEPAPLRFTIALARRAGKIGAVMELRDDQGALVCQNRDIAVDYDCKLLIDMLGDTAGAWLYRPPTIECPAVPACPPPPEPPPLPPPPPERPAPPAPLPPRNLSLHAGLDLLAHFAIMPAPGLGPGVFLALRLRDPAISFELDGRVGWTVAAADEEGLPTRGSYYSGALAVCTHVRFAFLCPTVGVGVVRFDASPMVYKDYPGFGTLGVRAGAELPIGERFELHAFVGGEALLGKLVVAAVHGGELRVAPSTAASVGLGMAVRLW